jgi:hypothetical protein
MTRKIRRSLQRVLEEIENGTSLNTLPFGNVQLFFELMDLEEHGKVSILMYRDNDPWRKKWEIANKDR